MRAKGLALLAVGIIVVGAAVMLTRSDEEAPEALAPEAAQVGDSSGATENASYRFLLGGQVGEIDQQVIEKLSLSVPGVTGAKLDVPTLTLSVEAIDGVFRSAALEETLARPGLGWTVSAP